MSEPIDLDQLLEQRERLAASIDEAEREASELTRRQREAKKSRAELKDLERQIQRAKLEQEEKPAGRWARLRFGVRPYAEMRRQVRELEAKNKRLRGYESKVKTVGSVAGRLVAGSELRKASRAWLSEARSGRPFGDELADYGAAVIRRVVRVGVAGLVLASIPGLIAVGLTLWQNFLMREQNTTMREQNTTIQEQLADQREDTLIVRRAQLLDTIYEQVCVDVPVEDDADPSGIEDLAETQEECKPKAHERARREAAQAFVKIENKAGNRVNFRGAQIPGVYLHGADLIGANFNHADLTRAILRVTKLRAHFVGANLTDAQLIGADLVSAQFPTANLTGADFTRADLLLANLRNADLSDADLRDADLRGADLRGADLRGADLRGADFRAADFRAGDLRISSGLVKFADAQNLTQDQINSAIGSEHTQLPKGLTMPDHWKADKSDDAADQ